MIDEHGHEHDARPRPRLDGADLEIDTQSQIFLEMRQQNLELLQIAAKVAGYMRRAPPAEAGRREERAEEHLGRIFRVLLLGRPRGVRRRRGRGEDEE